MATTAGSPDGSGEAPYPSGEVDLEGVRVDQQEYPPKGVVRRDTVGQSKKLPQPGELATAIEGDGLPPLGTGDHGTNGDHQDVNQSVLDFAGATRILEFREMLNQLVNQNGYLSAIWRGSLLYFPKLCFSLQFHA